ncbi:MAG: ring-hydroxylating oxygenase subunit alpha, partial [Alphaproteobacteria bacterium]|nr:ring-hydroxylating oxygenase subunit alpha [Alphaproteobacteria bacterium]
MRDPTIGKHGSAAGIDYGRLIEPDRVHGSLYTEAWVFADEMARIFLDGWVFVGHDSEIPNTGDWVTRRLGLEPV